MGAAIADWAINGLDLCSIQDVIPINAQAIADAGFQFVYVKSSQYSNIKDHKFDSLVSRLQGAGLRVGAYHFCSHDTDPEEQAAFFFQASGGLGMRAGELPPMLDWEYCTPSKYTDHPQHCVDWIQRASRAVDELWYPAGQRLSVCYTYPNYAKLHQPALEKSGMDSRPLCYASYKSDGRGQLMPWLPLASEAPLHKVPAPWTKATLVQYSGDKGLPVPGIAGDCDRQVFLGSHGDFDSFCGIIRENVQESHRASEVVVGRA